MMIPNKFNGYSRDGIRLYNDPTMIVATIANMGEGAAAAAAIAEAAAAATAAETAAAAATEQAATQAAAQQAGQAGIMQGASVPPPGVTPPGAPGLGAPVAPATPLPPAQPLPPAGADEIAYDTIGQHNVMNGVQPPVDPTAPVAQPLSPPPGPNVPPAQNLPWSGNPSPTDAASGANTVKLVDPIKVADTANTFSLTDNALTRGMKTAMDYVGKNPLTSFGGVLTAQKIGLFGGNDEANSVISRITVSDNRTSSRPSADRRRCIMRAPHAVPMNFLTAANSAPTRCTEFAKGLLTRSRRPPKATCKHTSSN